jgi:hypothetical protein
MLEITLSQEFGLVNEKSPYRKERDTGFREVTPAPRKSACDPQDYFLERDLWKIIPTPDINLW